MIATLEQSQRIDNAKADVIVASLENVNKTYGSVRALRGVDFRVLAGELVALLGPNGAGKTTAVKLLLGLMQPNSGRAHVFGAGTRRILKTGNAPAPCCKWDEFRKRYASASTSICFPAITRSRCLRPRCWPPWDWRNCGIANSVISLEARGSACFLP